MRYCQSCGAGHECTDAETAAAETAVRIAEINANRDITLARLGARETRETLETAETIAETDAEAEIISSIAAAEIIASEEPPQEDEGEPIVVEVPADPPPEPEPDIAPPVVETREPKTDKRTGYWDAYR